MKAIWSLDPGGSSGLAWGIIDETAPTVAEALEGIQGKGSMTVKGQVEVQAMLLWEDWRTWQTHASVEQADGVNMVVENFIIRPGMHGGGVEGVYPARIGWALWGLRYGHEDMFPTIHWQEPGDAMSFGTDKRLRSWGLWVRGREHERDAFRHLALRVAKLMK